MNRDWFAQSQPETRGRIKIGLEYPAADHRRSPRAGRRQRLLLLAAGGSDQPARHQEPDRRVGSARARQRRALRRARLGVLHPRGLRRVLSRLRRFVADVPGIDRQHLRAGVGARPGVCAQRRRHADLSRRRDASLQRRDRHRDHRGAESRAVHARLPRVPPQRGRRRREGADSRIRDRARTGCVARRCCWRATSRRRASRCAAPRSRSSSPRAPFPPAPTSSRTRSRPRA